MSAVRKLSTDRLSERIYISNRFERSESGKAFVRAAAARVTLSSFLVPSVGYFLADRLASSLV